METLKKIKFGYLPIILLCANLSLAQKNNLVPNPSFEEYKSLPYGEADFHLVKDWLSPSALNGEKASYPKATVDYMHRKGSGAAKIPDTYYGYIEPYDGDAVAHFGITNGDQDFREYLAVRLKSAPEVGKKYTVSFYLANAQKNSYGNRAGKDVHVLFTNDFPKQSRAEALQQYTPQLKMEEYFYSTEWKKISFTYIPTEPNLDVMVIGNFYPPSKTVLGPKFDGRYSDAYFFIDMVSVVPGEDSEPPVVAAKPKMIAISVKVLDKKTSKPVSSAQISIAAAESSDVVKMSDSEGKANFDLVHSEEYNWEVSAPNYQKNDGVLTVKESESKIEYTIYLERNPPRGTSVYVSAIDEDSKLALDNAVVTLMPPSSSERVRSVPTLGGAAWFSLPLWKDFEVKISKEGYLPFEQKVQAQEGTNPDSLYVSITGSLKKKEIKLTIKGTLRDQKTKAPLAGEVELKFAGKSEKITVTPKGTFELVMPYQSKLAYYAKAKGYLQEEDQKDISPSTSDISLNLDIELEKLEIGKTVTLKNVLFVQGQPTLLPESYPELDKLLNLLHENPEVKIDMAGHTDIIGNPVKNQQLSEARVKKIKEYLVEKGIAETRISGKGYGSSKPLYEGNDPNKRAQNRRVEFTIVE